MVLSIRWGLACLALAISMEGRLCAAPIIDFSPDTTGALVGKPNVSNQFGITIFGGNFSLSSDTTLTGGAIFSASGFGTVGDAARFLIFADVAGIPASTPLVDITTTVDTVDTLFTTMTPGLTRKHTTITPTLLAAGTYWFSLSGDGLQLAQATVNATTPIDDGLSWRGTTSLTQTSPQDIFFQLESAAVPEPSSFVLLSFGAIGLICYGRRKRKSAA